jgi:predicted TIM-barrel fold metal-dependent hydrolase
VIIDGLAYLPGPDEPGDGASVAALLAHMSALGISRTLVCGTRRPDGVSPNARTAEAVHSHPGQLSGLIRVSPQTHGWQDDLERYAGDPAFAGVLLHPWEDGFAIVDPGPRLVAERCADRGLPLTAAAGYPWVSEALRIGSLADQFPGTTFVLTNEGQLNISGLGAADVTLLLRQSPNVVLHTTGAYREDFLVSLVSQFGPERLMYASGYPRFSPEYELRRVQWADGISAEAKEHILGTTAPAVFSMPAVRP